MLEKKSLGLAQAVMRQFTRGRAREPARRHRLVGYLFILPALALEGVFFGYALVQTAWMSLYDWPAIGERRFVGLANYASLLADERFWGAVRFTLAYILNVTPLVGCAALGLALLSNQRLRGSAVFRSIYFAPVVISSVSASLIWLWIYNDLGGPLNNLLRAAGLIEEPIAWLGQVSTSLPAIGVMITWKTAGFAMIILLAGLQSIPDHLYESAALDGAGPWQRVRYITLPLLRPSIGLVLVLTVSSAALAFDQFRIMTRGGPANMTRTALMYIYDTAFARFQLGAGAAMAIVLMAMLVALSALQLRLLLESNL